jgi:hypothetical protein
MNVIDSISWSMMLSEPKVRASEPKAHVSESRFALFGIVL